MTSATQAACAIAALALTTTAAAARDQIRVVGSSTVFPYTQAVAEEFANRTRAAAPIVEVTGTGGGMQVFCGGIGEGFPDITGASRRMKRSEYDLCHRNGVTDVTEALIGYDGLSLALSRDNPHDWNLTLPQLWLALAAEVPVDGRMAPNPYRRWSQIDPALPDSPILVLGPPPTSGTRDAFVELAMHTGCAAIPEVMALADASGDDEWIKQNCSRMRSDGPFIEAGENDNLIVQRLGSDPSAMGIFGYSFLFENRDKLKDVRLDGVESGLQTIGDGSYPLSRPLYVYIKNAHRGVIPNLDAFVNDYVDDEALMPEGYLAERGLVALPEAERAAVQQAVRSAVSVEIPQ